MARAADESLKRHRALLRRTLVLGGAAVAGVGLLGLRMRHLQVVESDQFRFLADENRINIRPAPPPRGRVFDRNGATVADNVPNYRILIERERAEDFEEIVARLGRLFELDPRTVERARRDLARRSVGAPVAVAERASWRNISIVAVNAPALPGVITEAGLSRRYPQGGVHAHVVGYVGRVSESDIERSSAPEELLRVPRFQVGKSGLEAEREDTLRGQPGTVRVEVDAAGRVMRELGGTDSVPGSDIQITVDSELQRHALARLEGESASAVAIDCRSGNLLVCASSPVFDPNKFVHGISKADFDVLRLSDRRPLHDKAVQGIYPPGSTFKMVTAIAALEAGVIDYAERIRCTGHVDIGDRRFHCWKQGGHGDVDMHRSLRESCDVYYYSLAERLGVDAIGDVARRLGIGVRHELPMTSVAAGVMPTEEYKIVNRDEEWVVGDTVNTAIGQGFLLTSPLQLAVMTARLATGRAVSPRLVEVVDGVPVPVASADPLGFDETALKEVRRAMFATVNHKRGTAYGSRVLGGMRMAGKTGTSQTRNISDEERAEGVLKNEELEWSERDHALFVCYAPADDPQIALAVVVEHGGSGSSAAAPVARDIMLQALHGGDPPLSAYPASDRDGIRALRRRLRRNQRRPDTGGVERA